jgi:hypothetical protein
MQYQETATYQCARKHTWETTVGRFSPFESRSCPVCSCASKLLDIKSVQNVWPYSDKQAIDYLDAHKRARKCGGI